MSKTYEVKVYSKAGDFLNTWTNDVVGDISFNNEINSAGGQLKLTLARSAGDYGEGSDVDFGLKVKVYCFDLESPNGQIIFQGFISAYTPIYKDDKVEVTILSFGSELNDYMLQDYLTLVQTEAAVGKPYLLGYAPNLGAYSSSFSITIDAGYTTLQMISCDSFVGNAGYGATITLSRGSTLLGTAYKTYSDAIPTADFLEPIAVTTGETLTVLVTFDANTPIWNYSVFSSSSGFFVPIYRIYSSDGTTEVAYLSDDPSDIVTDIIDKYNAMKGIITYDSTIDLTGTSVSYTFNTYTVLEAINKSLELAPKDWYWYIDYAANLIHFRDKSATPDHTFSLEKDLIDARFEKRIEDVVNTIYFTGGEISPGVNMYRKYENTASINNYGRKSIKYSDQRVTLTATADTIANSILESKSEPELRVTLEILDSNNNQGVGYDIESIQVGDLVAVRNITQQVGLSTWDVSRWDEGYWDFNIYNLSSLQMQVQKITYNGDTATIYASTMATDVNKRIEDINRNLETLQTLANPTSPS
jgi:hypothetical protein